MKIKRNNAIGYIRVSTLDQSREGLSLEVQEEKIKQYVKLNNFNLVEVISDEGISGKNLDRPGMRKVLSLCKDRSIDHVIVYKIDRLTRSTKDLLNVIEDIFIANDVKFHSITEKIDTSTAQGEFFLTIIGAMAQMERKAISERTKTVLQYKIAKGEYVGSPTLGFKAEGKKLIPVVEELRIVKYIRKLKRQKLSLGKIARLLNAEGIPTKRGGLWYSGTIRFILLNEIYRGQLANV